MKRKLITSALPYINNVPHLGNLIQVLSADAFARFCRLRGYDTLYICGTDEYGTATETRAAVEGISPRELCDRYYTIHADIYAWFHIAFDKFGRTSTPIQTEIVQDIFKKLDAAGYIVERTIEQLYCDSCGRFLADRYVRGTCPHCGYTEARGDQCESCGKLLDPTDLKEPRCSSCGSTPAIKPTKHLYIDLPKLKDPLEVWIREASVKGAWANNALRMTEAWIRDGLRERAITRDLKWGIPVPKPGYENKVFYVWFDAPIGYISITGNLGEEISEDWRKFVDGWWKNPEEVELFQFIGKDNIPFHTVIFPSSLLGTGDKWTMLHHMSSTEYLNYESGKFSKSKGIGVFGTDVMETGIDADVWRFYIFYNRPEKADALFTWKDFQEKVNGELIGNLGNLVNRTLAFVTRCYGGVIPGRDIPLSPELSAFRDKVKKMEEDVTDKLERSELRDAFRTVFELSSYANKTFQEAEPWRKRTEDPPAAEALIRELCYVVRDIAVMIEPFMPAASRQIAAFFGLTIDGKDAAGNRITAEGATLSWADLGRKGSIPEHIKSEVLFSRLEDTLVDVLRDRYSGSQQDRADRQAGEGAPGEKAGEGKPSSHGEAPDPSAAFGSLLDLRTAQIVRIERHPKADKLYIETLEIAGEERIIVSGLVPFYKEEELLNKKIIAAYNLKPAKLRGVESRGMLLAASLRREDGSEQVEVLDAGDVPTGTRVELEGAGPGNPPAEIDIDTFLSVPLLVRDYTVEAGGKALTLKGAPVRTRTIAAGEVH
ncbi:MAG: methionine--tRNA ligase [Spirochaetaceae bacterium]|jgi:methionyl-tRNA synthetase|nr:methionine--tRNA ligase [Spirochaetaceae bacterium]